MFLNVGWWKEEMEWIVEKHVQGLGDEKLHGDPNREAFWQKFIMHGDSLKDKSSSWSWCDVKELLYALTIA